jgi:hypothetical protein
MIGAGSSKRRSEQQHWFWDDLNTGGVIAVRTPLSLGRDVMIDI